MSVNQKMGVEAQKLNLYCNGGGEGGGWYQRRKLVKGVSAAHWLKHWLLVPGDHAPNPVGENIFSSFIFEL